jgi:DNA-binding NtrC family response regulator
MPDSFRGTSLKRAKALAIEQFEKAYLSDLIQAHHGNITRAARAAQKERRAFGRLIKKYQLTAR